MAERKTSKVEKERELMKAIDRFVNDFTLGTDTPEEGKKMFDLLSQAEKEPDCPKEAYTALAICYEKGYGCEASQEKAKEYALKGKDGKRGYCQRYLGELYKNGWFGLEEEWVEKAI